MADLEPGGAGTALATRPAAALMPANALPTREEYSVMVGMANALAKAHGFIPRHFGGDGNKVFAALMYGRDLGFSPTQALQHIIVIEGKATTDAQAAGMLIRRAGHKLRDETTNEWSKVTITRWDDPDHPFEAIFTIEDARRAGLVKADSAWAKYPRAMLYARALMECARKACQDALMGVAYVAEELGADVDQTGHAIAPEYQVGPEPPPVNLMESSPPPERKPDEQTGEVPTEQATPASRAILDQAAAPAPESVPAVETPAAAAPPAEPRARRGVGPTPRARNVQQVAPAPQPVAEPLPGREEAPTPPHDQTSPPAAADKIETPEEPPAATEPGPDPFQPVGDDQRTVLRESIRQLAADLWTVRVRAHNRKLALEDKPPVAMPPDGPNPKADEALGIYIGSQFPGRSLVDLGMADLDNLQGALLGLIGDMAERERAQQAT